MATEPSNDTQQAPKNEQLLTWLSMIGGAGILLIVFALGIGVVNPDASSTTVGMGVLAGLALLVTGIGAWVIVAQPHKHFDDINVPQYHGHHDHDDAHGDDAHEAAH